MKSIKRWTNFSKKPNEFANTAAIFAIKTYQATLGLYVGGNCRFYPSCSHYAADAYKNHGFVDATKFVMKRLSSCHPFGSYGYDPVPGKGCNK